MPKQNIYTVGGTVQAGGGLYIKRKADDELLELCRQGEFAFILSSRQVGKSSLIVRTAQQLQKENIRSVTIDLSGIGVSVSQDEWYLGILNEIYTTLRLETDIFAWWAQYGQLGPAQRLNNFFKDIVLKEVKEQIVLFFDEIDSTLSIPFSDDFYVAIRAAHNARSTVPDFKRLSFVLVGVATPGDLISDNRRTPFNIGHRVEVSDFTLVEALPLANGLGEQAIQVLNWVFQYTGGHPYLTQRLCAYLAVLPDSPQEESIKGAVERLFTGEQGKQDNNLQFVRDMLSKRSPDVTRVLKIYKDIRSGKKVTDDERSIAKAHLKLSGLVGSEKGILRVRNEIYNSVFDLRWIQENTPKNWQKVTLISLIALLGFLLLATLAVFVNDFFVGTQVNESIANFISTPSADRRLLNLAKIYRQKGMLSNTDSSLQAAQLFYGLSANDQILMFTDYSIIGNPDLQNDLVIVVSHLYVTVADVNPSEDNTYLLRSMHDSLRIVSMNHAGLSLRDEINAWLRGRELAHSGKYQTALSAYNNAISLNSGNQATLYERAKVHIALEQYSNALKDLDAAIAVAKQSAPNIATPLPTASPFLDATELSTLELVGTPSKVNETLTPTPQIISSIEPTQVLTSETATPPPGTEINYSYESNFVTLIDVVNTVRTLIENTPPLQIAMQSNGQNAYSNLQSFGLVPIAVTATEKTAAITNPPVEINPTTEIIPFESSSNPGLLNPDFGWQPGDSPANAYDLSSHPNALTLIAGGYTDQWAKLDSEPVIFYPVQGDFETQVRIVFTPVFGHELAALGIRSPQDHTTWLRLGNVYSLFPSRNGLENHIVLDIDNQGQGNKIRTAPYPFDTVYLKIQREGARFAFYYSPNGNDWTTLQSDYVAEMPTNAEIFLTVGCWGDGGTSAEFSDFIIVSR